MSFSFFCSTDEDDFSGPVLDPSAEAVFNITKKFRQIRIIPTALRQNRLERSTIFIIISNYLGFPFLKVVLRRVLHRPEHCLRVAAAHAGAAILERQDRHRSQRHAKVRIGILKYKIKEAL